MKKKASVSHDEWMIEELRAVPKLAGEYLGQAMTDMSDAEDRGQPSFRYADLQKHMAEWPPWRWKREFSARACIAPYPQKGTPP